MKLTSLAVLLLATGFLGCTTTEKGVPRKLRNHERLR